MAKFLAVAAIIVLMFAIGCRSTGNSPPPKVGETPEARLDTPLKMER